MGLVTSQKPRWPCGAVRSWRGMGCWVTTFSTALSTVPSRKRHFAFF